MSIRLSNRALVGSSQALMRATALALILFFAAFASSVEAASPTSGGLTPKQSGIVLRLIDNHCADTWCEGDDNWHFRKILCSMEAASCTLTITLREHGSHSRAVWRTCKLGGYTGFYSIVHDYTGGIGYALNWPFEERMQRCAERIERTLPLKRRG